MMDKEQLLANYFSHRLTEDEEIVFNDLLEQDAEFKEQFLFEKNLKRIIKNKENQHLKSTLKRFESDIRQKSKSTSRKNYEIFAMAASVVVLIGMGWFGYNNFFSTNYNSLYEDNFQQYPNTVYTITRSGDRESTEREAFAAYESGNFQEALTHFENVSTQDKKPYIDFYMAQSHLQLKEFDVAQKYFRDIIKGGGDFLPESHWYLALTYLKQGDKKNAILQLQELTSLYKYNKEKANVLLQELE